MAKADRFRPLAIMPRLVCREEAAAYCGLSPQGFSSWIKLGRLPESIAHTNRWDLKAIDMALDSLSGVTIDASLSPLDEWRVKRARRSEGNS